jgi:hypothetical protein
MENMPNLSKPLKNANSSKKIKPKQPSEKTYQQKHDFLKWLNMYASGIQSEKLAVLIPQLSSEYQNLASELLIAILGTGVRPTAKFKIEKLPIDFIRILRTRITNPYFLIALLCNTITELELKKTIILDLGKITLSKEDLEYLLNKLAAVKDHSIQQIIWNDFLTNGILLQESWQDHQLRFLDWGFSHSLRMTKPSETLISLRSASDQFKKLDSTLRNKTYRKLLEIDVLTFIAFLLHISSESFSTKFLEQIIAKKNTIMLLIFLDNRQTFVGPWLENFERQFIAPILRTTLDGVMRFEDLLPFVIKQSYFSHLIPADTLSRAVSRCFKRDDEYSKLLGDVRVEQLNSRVEDLIGENTQMSSELAGEKSLNKEKEKRIREFEAAIENYETRLRNHMQTQNLGSDTLSQNAKADLLKALVESLDHLLQGTDGFPLERALQKIGLTRLGEPGLDFIWDSEVCETLTGAAMENGIVVRSGYTWLYAEKKVVIRRVLLKLK